MTENPFIDERGYTVHPGRYLKMAMDQNGISVDDIFEEYQLDVRPIIMSSSKRWIQERGIRMINHEEAGKIGEMLGIPAGLLIKACADFYRERGLM